MVEFRRQFWRPQDQLRDPGRVFRPEDRADADLPDALRSEAEGVLADMVRHAAEFFEPPFRFEPPAEVTRATESYREEEDKAGQFLKTRTAPHDSSSPSMWMTGKELRELYDKWSDENGFTALEKISSRKLGQCAKRLYGWRKTGGVIRYRCKESDHHLANDEPREGQEREGRGRDFPVNPYYEGQLSTDLDFASLPPSLPPSNDDQISQTQWRPSRGLSSSAGQEGGPSS